MADETPLPSADPASPASPHAPEDAWQARKCALLRDFGAWLDALPPAEALADVAAGEREAELPGLAQVFAETTALRQETRQVARQSREMGEALRAAGEALAAIGQRLGLAEAAVEAARARAADAAWKGKAEMAAEFAQLAEAVDRCAAETARPLPRFGRGRAARTRLDAAAKTLALVLEKARLAMRDRGLRATAAAGQPFDARSMRAVGVVRRPGLADGTVAEVARQGYELDGKAMEYAEVLVVRNDREAS